MLKVTLGKKADAILGKSLNVVIPSFRHSCLTCIIWEWSNPFFILVKDSSELISKLTVGDVINMKYYDTPLHQPIELATKIKNITFDQDGKFKEHYLVDLNILHDQNRL